MVESIIPGLQNLLRSVLCTKIGICSREISLIEVSTGKPSIEKNQLAINDRFRLKIPMADQYMIWQIRFNGLFPNCPPDFDLGDFDFYSIDLEAFEEALPTLNNWDCTKDKALINVISELRSAYLKYQVEKLEMIDNRWAYEYTSLISESSVMVDQLEVFVDSDTVHFLVKLDIDLSIILPAQEPDQFVLLAVNFGVDGPLRSASLIVSPALQRNLGMVLDLPRNMSDEKLSEYVEEVSRSIEHQFVQVLNHRKQRRKCFIFEILRRLGERAISYDSINYCNASFIIENSGFICILEVSLPPTFPLKPPSYRLLSLYSTSGEHPLSQVINVPYSDRWEVTAMVENALSAITSKRIQEFQKHTVPLFKLPK